MCLVKFLRDVKEQRRKWMIRFLGDQMFTIILQISQKMRNCVRGEVAKNVAT